MSLDNRSENPYEAFHYESAQAAFTPFKDRLDVNIWTHRINFADVACLEDPIIADACVVVLTSDGQCGTLSHIQTNHDPKQFAQDLKNLLNQDGIPVCLSSGSSTLPHSYTLLKKLVDELGKVGFHVSESPKHSDLLGNFSRRATLYPDRVVIMRRGYGDNQQWETREIRFPKIVTAPA